MSNGNSEEMLAQLIKMVGSLQVEFKEMKERQIQSEVKSEERHEELLRTIHSIKADQDYIWQKAVRNEREIEKLKNK
ncbi:hypothetical protein [Ureibacillus acetophenoni]|uniref:Uncharacterized protein n=1 Tax=Ureibacillus acetophenoni TaxID=614649 RepID=A0A285TYS4_9BACL|nr:hypothetical protein [Ureibacillus acetophenoni]SOC34850.1 hypothetical protein SAMN05877842_101128 [Ureibacillus acetophenoni]